MKLTDQVKPISYLKAHAPEIIRGLSDNSEPFIITVHGEAKAVLQDIATYDETHETMALLKILALGNQQIEKKKTIPATDVIKRLRTKQATG
jgi:prevent-host-death family protein